MNQEMAIGILFKIADGPNDYETEYDGRVYTFCKYCDHNFDSDDEHDNCLIFDAKKALGDEWNLYQQEKQRKQLRQEQKRIAQSLTYREICSLCGHHVAKHNLRQHENSRACKKNQEAV